MGALRIRLFGNVRVAREGEAIELKVTRTTKALLAYLLLYRHRLHPREALIGLFWGDHDEGRARSCLSTALWRLRQTLESSGLPRDSYVVTTPSGEVGFNPSSEYWLDVAQFEAAIGSAGLTSCETFDRREAEHLEDALELYTGELMEGFFEDWILRERERLRCVYLNCLVCLMHYHGAHGQYERSVAFGQKVLEHDPLREEIHRYLMRLHVENGNRAAAARQYETCCRVLREELSMQPMEETQALYQQIKGADRRAPAQLQTPQRTSSLEQAVRQLREAIQGFDRARYVLQTAVETVEQLTHPQSK